MKSIKTALFAAAMIGVHSQVASPQDCYIANGHDCCDNFNITATACYCSGGLQICNIIYMTNDPTQDWKKQYFGWSEPAEGCTMGPVCEWIIATCGSPEVLCGCSYPQNNLGHEECCSVSNPPPPMNCGSP